jgi:hypothetical protein
VEPSIVGNSDVSSIVIPSQGNDRDQNRSSATGKLRGHCLRLLSCVPFDESAERTSAAKDLKQLRTNCVIQGRESNAMNSLRLDWVCK